MIRCSYRTRLNISKISKRGVISDFVTCRKPKCVTTGVLKLITPLEGCSGVVRKNTDHTA